MERQQWDDYGFNHQDNNVAEIAGYFLQRRPVNIG